MSPNPKHLSSTAYSPNVGEGVSLLKNSFALYSAPGSGAESAVFVVFWTGFEPLSDRRLGRQLLFQQAGVFSEVELPLYGVLRSSAVRDQTDSMSAGALLLHAAGCRLRSTALPASVSPAARGLGRAPLRCARRGR